MKDQTSTLLELLDASGGRLHALLTRLTLREDVAEDLMQELFMKLVRSKGFAKAANKAAYARRAAMNLTFDWRRSRKRNPSPAAMTVEPVASNPSPLNRLIRDEQLVQILDATGWLSELCRDAFVLRHIQQEPYETIADQLGRTPHQVRALCHKTVEQIRAFLNSNASQSHRKENIHVED